MTLKRWQESMCIAGFGCGLVCAACGTYAWRVAALMRVGKKLSCSNLYRFIDTQGRGVHGPDERGLERLFTHNVKLYNCAAGKCGYQNLQYEAENFQTSVCDGMSAMARWDG